MPDEVCINDFADDEDEDRDKESNDLLHVKHMFQGRSTTAEPSACPRGLPDDLDRKSAEGWRLVWPVDSGYAHLVRGVG